VNSISYANLHYVLTTMKIEPDPQDDRTASSEHVTGSFRFRDEALP
jgi:hypothetical protein